MRVKRRTEIFSPILATSSRRRSSMLPPEASLPARSASRSVASPAQALCATAAAKPQNCSSRATKSVSQLISTIAALRPSTARSMAITPSAATRAAFLSAFARPCLRISSAAASRSPCVSTSAFLHSIIPAPVRSRSCRTVSAVTFMAAALRRSARAAARAGGTRGRTAPHGGAGARRRGDIDGIVEIQVGGQLRLGGLGGSSGGLNRGRHGSDRRGGVPARCRLAAAYRGLARRPRISAWLAARIAMFVELDKLILADRHLRYRGFTLDHGLGDHARVQLDGAHRIVIAGNDVIDPVGGAIGVDDRDHGYAQLGRLVNRNMLVPHIDHKQHVGERLHELDAPQALFELDHLAPQ